MPHNSYILVQILITKVIVNFPWKKVHLNWLVPNIKIYKYINRKIYVQNQQKWNKVKTNSVKPKLLKTLNIDQF